MSAASSSLLVSAAAIAIVHTALGPDHWLPFSMLARARGWSRTTLLAVTFWGGIGHVASSLALAVAGLSLGRGASGFAGIEALRGRAGPIALAAFGVAYGLWGVRRALARREGLVPHAHDGEVHVHRGGNRHHEHAGRPALGATTFWTLFAVFVLGPCEPLIPIFVLPASRGMWALAGWTALVFAAVTVAAMMALVALASSGVERLPWGAVGRWSHALAGGVIAACGLGVLALGL